MTSRDEDPSNSLGERRRFVLTPEDHKAIAEALKESIRNEASQALGNGMFRWFFDKFLIAALIYAWLHWGGAAPNPTSLGGLPK